MTTPFRRDARPGFASRLLDLVLPPVCIHCSKPTTSQGQLCPACWNDVHFITPPLCDITGLPLPHAIAFDRDRPHISALALAQPPVYDRARAVARFGSVMRTLIHRLKYGDRRESLRQFGRWMAIAGGDLLKDTDLIVPVPLYRARLWQRRFNQSALLAHELARLTRVPVHMRALSRHKATRSQVGLSQRQRRHNVAGAFVVRPQLQARIANRKILLIDDVLTTGATVDACARALKKAGATRVDVLVLARAGHLDGPDPLASDQLSGEPYLDAPAGS